MKRASWVLYGTVIIALLAAGTTLAQTPAGTAFTYQGQLKENGVPVNTTTGSIRVALYDAETSGNQIGESVGLENVTINNGLFTIPLDFGTGAFGGEARWLQIAVWKSGTGWVTLTPRQKVTPAPQAQFAQNSADLAWPVVASYDGGPEVSNMLALNYSGDGHALVVNATGTDVLAIYATTTELDTVAVYGQAAGAVSAGVGGYAGATGPDAAGVGGRFITNGDKGMGVYGNAQSSTGVNYGVRGESNSAQGYGGYFVGRGYFSGNVGIGTTNPYEKLHVETSEGIALWAASSGPTGNTRGIIGEAQSPDGVGVVGYNECDSGDCIGIWGYSTSPEGFGGYFLGRGYFSDNVGIGTTTPSYKLHVASSDTTALYAGSSVGSGNACGIIGETLSPDGAGVYGYNDQDGGNSIGVCGQSNSPDGFGGYFYGRGYFSGNVGIGVLQPTQKLDVAGTVKSTGLQLTTSPTAGYVLTCNATGVGSWQPAGAGSCLWHLNGSNIYYDAGWVAIGTTDPSYYPLRVVNNGSSTAISGECPGEGNYGYLGDEYAGVRGVGYYGVYGETTAATGTAVVGTAYGAGTLSNIGGNFSANGNTGTAVLGTAYGTGALSNIGGKFSANGNTGTGVYGIASATTGDSFGVHGEVNSPTGTAVYAEAKATSGTANGVFANTASTQGSGVFGQNTSPTGDNEGVNGVSWSPDGKGVMGWNGCSTGNAYGVLGRTASATGIGVFGEATQASGTNYGVYGKTSSANGYAGYFNGRSYFSGNVGLGVANPAQKLDVAGTIQTTGFKLTSSPTAGYVLTSDASGTGTWLPAGGESLWQEDGSNIYYAGGNVGVGVMSPDATLDILGGNWDPNDPNTGGDLRIGNDLYGLKVCVSTSGGGAGDCRIRSFGATSKLMLSDASGDTLTVDGLNVGVGTTVPTTKLDVIGTVKMNGFKLTAAPTDGYVLTSDASGSGTWKAPTGAESLWQAGTGGIYYNDGNVGIGTSAPADSLQVVTTGVYAIHGQGGVIGVKGQGSNIGVLGDGTNEGVHGQGGLWGVLGTGGTDGVQGYCPGNGDGVHGESVSGVGVRAIGNGTGTGSPALLADNTNAGGIAVFSTCTSSDANLVAVNKGIGDIIKGFSGADGGDLVFQVENNGKTHVSVLQITGGADLSEQFDVQPTSTEIKPGMVVCIDPANPGKLVVSAKAYDRMVAGIISGAGGVSPGLTMGQRDTVANGQHPVALSGRVYVWADASHGSIAAGDLLTTSDVAGHAMKVADHGQAQGAILGKAMTGLQSGQGLVLVLVTLQ